VKKKQRHQVIIIECYEIIIYLQFIKTKNTGMLARGKYAMKTQITDDDKKVYLTWEWNLEIAKDWK
jgi:hypothetical protein